jgi:pyruvate dehydrogenase E1 component alpha subunit
MRAAVSQNLLNAARAEEVSRDNRYLRQRHGKRGHVGRTDPPSATNQLLALYRAMRLVREAEERLGALFAEGEIPGFIHLSIGQEAVAVGVAAALEKHDTLASNHRGHGHAIAKGLVLDRFFLEILGKRDGYCGGRGGSMHVADMTVGMLGANGIVGAGLPIAVGSALAHKLRNTSHIAVVFFGDGAMAEGVVHESLNLAQLWTLPVLFVCENNGWSEFTEAARQLATDPQRLAAAYSMRALKVDGNDVVAVAAAARMAVAQIRAGDGPCLLECKTTRVRGHFEGDPQRYRDASDITTATRNDPLVCCAAQAIAAGASPAAIDAIQAEIKARVDAAVATARAGAPPTPIEAFADVYSPIRESLS